MMTVTECLEIESKPVNITKEFAKRIETRM